LDVSSVLKLVATHDDLQQIFGSGVREFAHAEVVDDESGTPAKPAERKDLLFLLFA
jgi:hypothetical protein